MLASKVGWSFLMATAFWFPGVIFNSCILERAPQQMQSTPSWSSRKADAHWHSVCLSWTSKILEKRGQLRHSLLQLKRTHRLEELLLEPVPTELAFQGHYGELPEVYVDHDQGAVFPFPISKPNRFSWYQTALLALHLIRKLDRLERHLSASQPPLQGYSLPAWKTQFETLTSEWNEINTHFITLAQKIRYLSTWPPLLEAEQQESLARGQVPFSETLANSLFQGDQKNLDNLRSLLRPHRIIKQTFLPEDLDNVPAGIISIPITTDIRDKRFLAEIEGALMTHWNQSSWAKEAAISFHIHWKFMKSNAAFSTHKETILQHLARFPSHSAIITTGGLTTHVKGNALILGPGKITPRTLAHELGHILGFNDCYLRTLTGQGIFGMAVLEWDNPLYPDDIMCDNTYGEPRVEVW